MSQIPTKFYLIVQRGPGSGTAYALQGNMVTIGRQLDNYVVIDDSQVSRRHVRLTWEGGGYFLEDLKSKNGTWVNDMRVSGSVRLQVGDVIDLGPRLRLIFSDRPEPPPEPGPASRPNVTVVAPAESVIVNAPSAPVKNSPIESKRGIGIAVVVLGILSLLVCAGCVAIILYFSGYLG